MIQAAIQQQLHNNWELRGSEAAAAEAVRTPLVIPVQPV